MAKFKLYLMSLRGSESEFSPRYSLMAISEFNTQYNEYDGFQQPKNDLDTYINNRGSTDSNMWSTTKVSTATFIQDQSFTYTSNEKFQIHQNSQRTLTFTMYRNVIRADRIEINPFINYLFVGAQLLLVDKYDNHHLMTVSKISYQFNELNTEFSYECQDSFSYQLSRQNAGYEIENNTDADINDFIGAQSLDWWVLCKIHPDCKISYQYLKLDESRDFKQAYVGDQYRDYHRTVPFSGSGTANSILIALGELFGLQLQVYERVNLNVSNANYGLCEKYYWFIPTKSLRPTGLKYSPYGDLQNFTLEHTGNSFASVLNVQSNTIGEEIITMFPSVPNFFRQWFETDEWRNSSFYAGLFSSACQEHVDYFSFDGVNVEAYNGELDDDKEIMDYKISSYSNNQICRIEKLAYIPIKPPKWYTKYDFIQFSTNGGAHSKLNITFGEKSIAYNSRYNNWKIVYKLKKSTSEDTQEETVWSNESTIPYDLINKNGLDYFYLVLDINSSAPLITVMGGLYVSQYRIPTSEELEFAEIADQIPWLENKLISFDYFYEHSIINAAEHAELMRLLENNLRKTNAKLLLYSQLYYKSIQQRTEILSELSAKLDMVGATFQSDILNPYFEDGRTTKTTDFTLAISDLFANSTEPISLLGYYETLSDYVNKYFNAEQTFLKNMHLFRDYFNSKANLGILYKYTFTLPNQDSSDIQISFTTPNQYVSLSEKNQHYPIYEKVDDGYQIYNRDNIVTSDTVSRFHYLDPEADKMIEIKDTTPQYHTFNDKQQYFELAWKVKVDQNKWPKQNSKPIPLIVVSDADNSSNKFELELLSSEENTIYALLSCYMSCLHTTKWEVESKDFKYNGTTITVQIINNYYKPVDYTALRNNFFYKQLNTTNRTKLKYMHRRKSGGNEMLCQVPIGSDSSASWVNIFSDLGIDPQVFLSFPNSKNWNSQRIDNLKSTDSKVANTAADDVYKESFPITTMYWKGKQNNDEDLEKDYHDVPFVNIENCQQFHRRVSVSCEERTKWGNSGYFVVPLLIAWMAYWAWNDGLKDFGNSGWTYHDIFNCDYSPACGDGWTKSTRFMYVTNSEGYEKTHKREIFASSCFDTNNTEGWKGSCDNIYQDLESEDNDTATVEQWGYYEAKHIPLTYYSFMKRLGDHRAKYHYKTKYWRILKNTDTVNNLEGIEAIVKCVNIVENSMNLLTNEIPLQTEEGEVKINRLNSTVYYPLKHVIVAQNLSEFTWPENLSEMPLGELLANNTLTGEWNEQGTIWTGTISMTENGKSKSVEGSLIFIKTEDFNYEDITDLHWETINNGTINYDNLWEYVSSPYYDNKTHQQINLITEYPDITVGFYITGNEDEDYIPATNVDESKIYYEHIENKYEPRYTMNQLINSGNMYVKRQEVYEHMSFNQIETLNATYFVYDVIQNTTKEEIGTIQQNTETKEWILTGESINEPIKLTCPTPTQTDYNDCTNGWFWYKNRNAVASPILMEKAMLIETNLTEYWTNAYYASKNCKFFIPEHWQPTVNQKTNYFSNNILLTTKKKNIITQEYEDADVKLSSTYIPQVIKIPNQPRYQLRHAGILDSLQTTRAIQYGLNVGDSVIVSSITETPIQQVVDYLKLNSSEWMAVKLSYGDNVLYQHQNGGMLWTDALNKLTNTALQYDQFGGWYDMMVRVLQSCNYQNYDPIQYRQAQEEHDAIWRQIYIKYPNLIYEQSYVNEDVTSSKELLTMAQWAFRDYSQPESNYNISVIDSNTLKGYKGQELAVGDGIEVNATELYDDAGSDIYKSLVQYLYITDINYDLRQDDNIQLTVNSIKYRDKVIGELVKLIR